MADSNDLEDIFKMIDDMQARLVDLFDQFRELRIRLGHIPAESYGRPLPSKETPAVEQKLDADELGTTPSSKQVTQPDGPLITPESHSKDSQETSFTVRVSRLLDPISHELTTGSSSAEVIAEYLQTAKDDLIGTNPKHEKVSRDMEIVLKFLRARGKRGIRPEERDNIIRRIKRWKAHLSR